MRTIGIADLQVKCHLCDPSDSVKMLKRAQRNDPKIGRITHCFNLFLSNQLYPEGYDKRLSFLVLLTHISTMHTISAP